MELNNKTSVDDIVRTKRDHIYIDKSDNKKYKLVIKKLPFKNNLHAFTVAAFVGYYYADSSKKIERQDQGFIHLSVYRDSRGNSHYLDFLKTLAIVHEKDVKVLVDEKRLYSICEGYARTGIDLLVDWMDSNEDSLENIIAKRLNEKFNELNLK